ncbi:MAG: GNAT family N-acetyltransferase [Micrococcales bacterium]|nr:GNAT family N-acetyltransferase [Micrococcales bacterium]OJX67308.1 MAG: hypothetical protein BGO94_00235 [Micrococcales bacterium 72-143]
MTGEAEGAYAVWLAARSQVGPEPSATRRSRVAAKLSDPVSTLFTVARDGEVVGMLLAEPFRADGGTGAPVPEWGHVSMAFVHPGWQRRGVGRELMARLVREGDWASLSLWTAEANSAAQALYAGCGFVPASDVGELPDGRVIRRWVRTPRRAGEPAARA